MLIIIIQIRSSSIPESNDQISNNTDSSQAVIDVQPDQSIDTSTELPSALVGSTSSADTSATLSSESIVSLNLCQTVKPDDTRQETSGTRFLICHPQRICKPPN